MREHNLSLVCVDAPAVSGLPWVPEITTPELFVVHFHGRSEGTRNARTATVAELRDLLASYAGRTDS